MSDKPRKLNAARADAHKARTDKNRAKIKAQSYLEQREEYRRENIRLKMLSEQQQARIAELESKLAAAEKDAARLDWMSSHEAWLGWNREGELCRVFMRSDDPDDFRPTPVCGWSNFYDDARKAIDAAIAPKGE